MFVFSTNLFVVALCYLSVSTAFRPPAVPLINMDPYMNIWSMADNLTDDWSRYWPGEVKAFAGLIRIDGAAYRFMGPQSQAGGAMPPAMPQLAVHVNATTTHYSFEASGVSLKVLFTTPLLPELLSLKPVTYVRFHVHSVDSKAHSVQLYFDNTGEICVNQPTEAVVWSRVSSKSLQVMRIGTSAQKIFGRSGDNVGINWGYFYSSARTENAMTQSMNNALVTRSSFAANGTLPPDNLNMPRNVNDGWPVLATAWSFSIDATGNAVTKTALLSYDDIQAIDFFGEKMRGVWTRNGTVSAVQLLQEAFETQDATLRKAHSFDQRVFETLAAVGGNNFGKLGSLAYRQVIGSCKLVWNEKRQEPWYFIKEISSDGDLSTVDVIYPAAPFFLHFHPKLLERLLIPILAYANNETSQQKYNYTDVWAPHHLGFYPVGDIMTKDQENMPVEETGNMLLMITAVEMARTKRATFGPVGPFQHKDPSSFYPHYWPLLQQWAQYLTTALPDPGNQLCTDDFEGPSPHNVNLAAKGIVALASFVELCRIYNDTKLAQTYQTLVNGYVKDWMKMAWDNNHYRLQYNLPNTWSMKYNLLFQKLLKLEAFPQSVFDLEEKYYLSQMNSYGVPLDDRRAFAKFDWMFWVASLSPSPATFQSYVDVLYKFADQTATRVPLTDWFWTTNGTQTGFQARPVVGGLWAKMCMPK